MTYDEDTLEVVDIDGNTWQIDYNYETKCLRQGTYSCMAEDPEEYFGIFEYRLLNISYAYCEDTDEELIEDFPDWMEEEIEDHLEYM